MLLTDRKIILASGSPRRIKMLQDESADFEIIKPGCAEEIHTKLSPSQTVMALALRKALNVTERLDQQHIDEKPLIIACDTIVAIDGKVIGKPVDEKDAFEILSELNGNAHQVWSGVCIIDLHKIPLFTLVFSSRTDVYFKQYSDKDISDYIASGEPMDKAGAYAIQGGFGKYIDHFEGAYDNVVGFPMEEIKRRLLKL